MGIFDSKNKTKRKMNTHWQAILKKINHHYEIKKHENWLENDKIKLKTFQSALEQKVKVTIIENVMIAGEFLSKKNVHAFIELTKEQRVAVLDTYIFNNELKRSPKINDRTLEKVLCQAEKPKHNRIADIFAIYIFGTLFEDSLSTLENNRPIPLITIHPIGRPNSLSEKLAQFYGTHWWVYYFDETNHTNRIGRAVLTIQNRNQATLTNEETETSTHYLGHIELEYSSQHICLDLTAKGMRDKHLRITLFIGIGRVYPLLLGVYTNIRGDNAMVAGSIILEKVEEISTIQQMQPGSFSPTSAKSAGIDESIIAFLKDRNKNNLRIPSGIFTKEKLRTWKKNQILRNQNKTDT